MTAPLPPPTGTMRVPMIDDECNYRGHQNVPAWDSDAVKLAVREALERAKEAMYELGAKDRAACAAIVRAMIEEYR